MAKRQTGAVAPVVDRSNVKGERAGTPGKPGHHEGPAGAGPVTRSKFNKDARDATTEKEPGKSRGPGG